MFELPPHNPTTTPPPAGKNIPSSPSAETPIPLSLSPRGSVAMGAGRVVRSPLVFGAGAGAVAGGGDGAEVVSRRRKALQWDSLARGRCPRCGRRLSVRVVGFVPVFEEVVAVGEDVVGLRSAVGEVPAHLEAECPGCGFAVDFPRERRDGPVEEFEWLLAFAGP